MRCTMDLCITYDNVPPMSLGISMRPYTLQSSHKAEASDSEAPLGTRGRMKKIMPASPCHPVV